MNATIDRFAAYRDFQMADDAFQAELRRVYGKDAGDRRYQAAPHADSAVEATKAAFEAAGKVWRAAWRESHP